MSMLVAIGGTGQEATHFYLVATLLGLANRQGAVKKVAVIDQNNIGASVQTLAGICNQLVAAGTPRIPEVVLARPYEFGDDDTLALKITGVPTAELPIRSPVRAMFPVERDGVRILDQPLRRGLFYKPVIGATLDVIEPAAIDDVLTFRDDRATIVGSITGGTLTGFLPATLDRLEAEHKYATAILFGRWFVMDQVSGARQRTSTAEIYDSNCAGVLSMLAERKNNIAKWVLLDGEVRRREDGTFGQQTEDFEGANDPRLEACVLIDAYQNEDFRGERTTFEGARQTAAVVGTDEWFLAWQAASSTAHAVLSTIQDPGWVPALHDDPFARFVWGQPLAGFVSGAWRAVHAHSGARDTRTATTFADDLARNIDRVAGTLRSLLPRVAGTTRVDRHRIKVRARNLSRVNRPARSAQDYDVLCAAYAAYFTRTLMEMTDAEAGR